MHKLALVIFLSVLAAPTTVAADGWPDFPFLVAEGKATAEVPPDKAKLSLSVSAFDANSSVAVETVQNRIGEVLSVFKKYAVPGTSITSHNLVKEVERSSEDRVELEIIGYYVSRRMSVDLDDISQFSDLVADLASLDNVSSINTAFDVSTREDIEANLMSSAGSDARRKAESMARGMDTSLGSIFAISESSVSSSLALFGMGDGSPYYAGAPSIRGGYAATVFVPSTITLRQSVNVIFELKR